MTQHGQKRRSRPAEFVAGILADIHFPSEISRYLIQILFAVLVGALAGAGAILFHHAVEEMRIFFHPRRLASLWDLPVHPVVFVPVAGALVLAFATARFPRIARERGVAPQIIALSAVIGDVNDFDKWLGSAKLITTKRPVPLLEGVLDRSGTFQLMDPTGAVQNVQLLPPGAVRVRKEKPSTQDILIPLVRELVNRGDRKSVV